jgi:hypothetical protein
MPGRENPQLLKFSRPQTAHFDMQIISATFQGEVITAGFGKVSTKHSLRMATKKAGPQLTLPEFI